MPRFFITETPAVGDTVTLTGGDARHIAGALRTRPGERLTLCDGAGTDYGCVVTAVEREAVCLTVETAVPNRSEPDLAVTLYMGLPKADKLEWIIQKAVELGVTAIVPVETRRSIARVDPKDAAKKQERRQRIADEAAGQSGRGIRPVVEPGIPWKTALTRLAGETAVICYEGGGVPLGELPLPADRRVSLIVGPEGGFDPDEVAQVVAAGGKVATLGPRILRCETAPLAALTVLMERSGNMK